MSHQPTGAMTGNIKLRNYTDPTLSCIFNNLSRLFLCVEQTVGTHLMQLRKLFTLDTKALVFSKVPMKHIEFHGGHRIEISFQHFGWLVVSSDVNQQPAPTKPWLILNFYCW